MRDALTELVSTRMLHDGTIAAVGRYSMAVSPKLLHTHPDGPQVEGGVRHNLRIGKANSAYCGPDDPGPLTWDSTELKSVLGLFKKHVHVAAHIGKDYHGHFLLGETPNTRHMQLDGIHREAKLWCAFRFDVRLLLELSKLGADQLWAPHEADKPIYLTGDEFEGLLMPCRF